MLLTREIAREQIARGVALLDQTDPGWMDRIDVLSLALSDCNRCVLGQLHGEFFRGAAKQFGHAFYQAVTRNLAFDHGFVLDCRFMPIEQITLSYEILTDAWREAILARRAPVIIETPAEELELVGV